MAKGQCKATILQGGVMMGEILVGASTNRCNKDAGHEKAKQSEFDSPRDYQLATIHDASGVTWYDADPGLDQFDSED